MLQSACRCVRSLRLIPWQLLRKFSSYKEIDLSEPCTIVCKSGTVACWHPERSFPYEHSKPIDPREYEAVKQNSSVLSEDIERIADLRGSFARTGPRNHILREIFYTGKHEWYTRYREERLRSVAAPEPKKQN